MFSLLHGSQRPASWRHALRRRRTVSPSTITGKFCLTRDVSQQVDPELWVGTSLIQFCGMVVECSEGIIINIVIAVGTVL